MTDDQDPQQHPHPGPREAPPPRQKWDSTVNTRALGMVVVVVALVLVVGLGFSMCTRVATSPGVENSYGILERRVDEAFDTTREQPMVSGGSVAPAPRPTEGEIDATAAPPQGTPGAQPTDAETQQMEDIEQQRQIMQQQEELRSEQRDSVPSLLPENPPTPVPLGGKY